MNYHDLFYFIKVVEKGSMVVAADFLKVPTSTLSRRLQALEQDLGYKLLHRNAKKFGLTEPGQRFYGTLSGIFFDLESSAEDVKTELATISGDIRITAPITAGHFFVKGWIFEFMKENPLVSLDVLFTNEPIDLVASGIDVAFRLGDVTVNDWVVRELHTTQLVTVATPELLQRHPPLATPMDLDKLPSITLKRLPYWRFYNSDGDLYTFSPRSKLRTDELGLAISATLNGIGVCCLPKYAVQSEIDTGSLIALFDDWAMGVRKINMLYSNRTRLSNKIRLFVDFIIKKYNDDSLV